MMCLFSLCRCWRMSWISVWVWQSSVSRVPLFSLPLAQETWDSQSHWWSALCWTLPLSLAVKEVQSMWRKWYLFFTPKIHKPYRYLMYDVISVFFRSIWNSTFCIFLTLVTIIMSYFHLCNNICHSQQVFTDEFSKRFLGQSASASASNPTQPQSTGAQNLFFLPFYTFSYPNHLWNHCQLTGLKFILVDELSQSIPLDIPFFNVYLVLLHFTMKLQDPSQRS